MNREDIEQIKAQIEALKCKTAKEVEEARVQILGKKGQVTRLFEEFRTIDKDMKREFGKTLNELKQTSVPAQIFYKEYKGSLPWRGDTKIVVDSIRTDLVLQYVNTLKQANVTR